MPGRRSAASRGSPWRASRWAWPSASSPRGVVARLHDANAATIVTFLVAYLAYLAAEEIHASGVLAVVACGLMLGGREHETFDARTRTHALAVWGFVVFVLEALVFVLIGLALRGVLDRMGGSADALIAGLPLALAATATCVAARLAWVFPPSTCRGSCPGPGGTPSPRSARRSRWWSAGRGCAGS